MTLTSEWRGRLDHWREELVRHIYIPLDSFELTGFTTGELLSAEEAASGTFEPMPPGTEWGGKWEYGWFKGQVTLPEAAAGERVVLRPDVGAESVIYINGEAAGAIDEHHHEVRLTRSGEPGASYDVLIEAYAGHGQIRINVGPHPPGREVLGTTPATQRQVGHSNFGIWREDVYQLWIDVETLYGVREHLNPDSLRVSEIDAGLRDFTLLVDFSLPKGEFLQAVRAARGRLRPLLAAVNGSTAPTMFAFGHAHIDVAWLWPLAETRRKCVRTFANQLALMEEYPEYRFLQSMPELYQMVKESYPDLYQRIKQAVEQGQFIPEGSAWVEPDTNISSGESLIRQFLHGLRFYRDEFGVNCKMLWLPDVFGYSGALPQIMRGCGIEYFSSQKIFWAYHDADTFPYNTFVWEGIDGSEVYVHLHNNYNSRMDPGSVITRWRQRVQKDGFDTRLMPFGWGDGGGGPTRNHLEYARRERDLEGVPRVQLTSPIDYFEDQAKKGWPDGVRYVGELYFQGHRGTYTSQARTKWGNRKSEFSLREAELWGIAAQALSDFDLPTEALDDAWRKVLRNQFHDILPGSSIERVYEEAEADYEAALQTAGDVVDRATQRLIEGKTGFTVFNSLSWERTGLLPLPDDATGFIDASGDPLSVQSLGDETWVEVTVPACGWTSVESASRAVEVEKRLKATERALENESLRLKFDDRGAITSIFDKQTGQELAAGLCNEFQMYQDVPTNWEAWDIDSVYEQAPVPLEAPACIEVIADGPLFARLRITRKLHQSTMTQEVTLRRDSRRVDFHTVIDWQERQKLLKVSFPVDVQAHEAIHEIQFGHIRRPNHRSRQFDRDRYEVAQQKWTALAESNRGCAVLNDCKYGVNVLGKAIKLTLLRAPLAPDPNADRGRQEFTYAFYAWNGPFAECDVVREGYELNVPLRMARGTAEARSLFSVDAPNVVIETVKPADDGSGDVIVRLYESKRTRTDCQLTTSLPVVEALETNMVEENGAPLLYNEGEIALEFRPFEVKTLRLSLAK